MVSCCNISRTCPKLLEIAFAELQSVCSRIMIAARDESSREEYLASVRELRAALDRLNAIDLHAHRFYVLFPLTLILGTKVAIGRHDASLCGTLECLLVLATKARLDESHVLPMIERLALMLGDGQMGYSAEARRIMADLLGAMLEGAMKEATEKEGPTATTTTEATKTTYLSKELVRPLVGNVLSVLLNHPFNDVTLPASIVMANQVASLTALSKLIQAAGRQQIAFFVPGIATGLVKRLVMQLDSNLEGDMVTTKRTSMGIVAALHCLETLLVVTIRGDCARDSDGIGDPATVRGDYISQLRKLSTIAANAPSASTVNGEDSLQVLEDSIDTDKNALHVEVTPGWTRATAIRVADLLALCLPKLSLHQNPAVRLQVVRLSSRVLETSAAAFESHDDVLVDALLLLAQDDWPSVRSAAKGFLTDGLGRRQRERLVVERLVASIHVTDGSEGAGVSRRGASDEHWHRHRQHSSTSLTALPRVLKERSEVFMRHEVAKICSLIECCRTHDMPSVVGTSGIDDNAVLDALVACFRVDETSAVLVAAAPLIASTTEIMDAVANGDGSPALDTHAAMPTMPAALLYITSKGTYDMFARLVRLLAADALRREHQDPTSTSFSCFVALCVRRLRLQLAVRPKGNASYDDRLRASALLTIISEVFAGAVEFVEGLADNADDAGDRSVQVSSICKTAVLDVLYAFQDGDVWLLHTVQGMSASHSQTNATTTSINAILLQRCLVFVGVAARCLKVGFVDDGECTVTCLLPVVERYAEDSQYVSAAAKDTVHGICRFCGYPGGLRDLIRGNMDYIIDGMCTRLRQPSLYPNAPKLFAALLRQNGVAVSLVPLLAEPAQQMIRGVSILQRRERPENVLAFVLCTQEIAQGIIQVSREGLEELRKLVAREGYSDDGENDDSVAEVEEEEEKDGSHRTTSMGEISEYFRDRIQMNNRSAPDDSAHIAKEGTIVVTRGVWDETFQTKNRLEAAATLAQSIADYLGPLSVSKSLSVSVQSFTATMRALEGLRDAHHGLELFKNVIQESMVCEGQTQPPSGGKKAPPTFLPSVHLFWTPVMGALKDWRVPVIEACLEALETILVLAPDFLSKRFRSEAWPVLRALMKNGTPMMSAIASSGDRLSNATGRPVEPSPALVSRIRRAVVGLFSNLIDKLNSKEARDLLQPIARPLLRDVLGHACESGDRSVVDAMRAGFERISSIHPDSAWATLYTYGVECHRGDATKIPELSGDSHEQFGLATFQDFRQWGDDWFWVTNQLQSLMI